MSARLRLRPAHTLPFTSLPWLSLHDHFVATVGAQSGQGRALGSLRVLADARFAAHSRFPLHPHQEVEILSVVVDGELSHHGDQAHAAVIRPRGAQLISSRSGMFHAEGNVTDHPTHMLQLWFTPESTGGAAAYFERQLPAFGGAARHLLAGDAGMPMRCDAKVWWLDLAPGETLRQEVPVDRLAYLIALTGGLHADQTLLAPGDGAEVSPGAIDLTAETPAAALWIDLPA